MIALVVHGGAGRVPPERHDGARAGCLAAAQAGIAVLAGGGAALDAVQAAVRVLEDDPRFNAGTGAVLTRAGTVELDAAIMDGATGRIGAVAAVPDLACPIALARAVLDDGEHALLAGPAAWAFARTRGLRPAPPGALITGRARQRLAEERARRDGVAVADAVADREREGGTVGAVALDATGGLAAATSTGGINYKRPGRVGDTPLPGCGTWADDRLAASATGDGEAILRVMLTRGLAAAVAAGTPPRLAADAALAHLVARTGGAAGVIAVDRDGRLTARHVTEAMPVAVALLDDEHRVRCEAWIRPGELDDLAAATRATRT